MDNLSNIPKPPTESILKTISKDEEWLDCYDPITGGYTLKMWGPQRYRSGKLMNFYKCYTNCCMICGGAR